MPEIFPHTLGGGLEIWASIYFFVGKRKKNPKVYILLEEMLFAYKSKLFVAWIIPPKLLPPSHASLLIWVILVPQADKVVG